MYQCVSCRDVKRQCNRGVPCARCISRGVGESCYYPTRRSSGREKLTNNTLPHSVPAQPRGQLCAVCQGKHFVIESVKATNNVILEGTLLGPVPNFDTSAPPNDDSTQPNYPLVGYEDRSVPYMQSPLDAGFPLIHAQDDGIAPPGSHSQLPAEASGFHADVQVSGPSTHYTSTSSFTLEPCEGSSTYSRYDGNTMNTGSVQPWDICDEDIPAFNYS